MHLLLPLHTKSCAQQYRTNHRSALGIRSASELLASPPEPVTWIVDGLLPSGVTLLASVPKAGKSFWALSVAISCATGTDAFGTFGVNGGDCLYLDADMASEQRFHSRTKMLMRSLEQGESTNLNRLHYSNKRMTMQDGLIGEVDSWAKSVPQPRMVIVDTFGSVRGKVSGDAYQADLECVGKFSALSKKFNINILLVHHASKNRKGGTMESILSSTGLVASVDSILILSGKTLTGTGRDTDAQTYKVDMQLDRGKIILSAVDGTAIESSPQSVPERIEKFVRDKSAHVHRKQIVEVFGESSTIDTALRRLVQTGTLRQISRGVYEHWEMVSPATTETVM